MTASAFSRLSCASRSSALATVQAQTVATLLARRGIASDIVRIVTTGDRDRRTPLHALRESNVFVRELEAALRDNKADYAVHSCKDLPSTLDPDMRIAAIAEREDPRDAFCSGRYPSFASLPAGASVGTSSLRRRSQMEALRDDLSYVDVRGNVDTRLRRLEAGEYDALVLAMAGLNRLRCGSRYVAPFEVDELVPAASQGALAIEVRAADDRLALALRAAANDERTERCVACERAALRALRAGCGAPVGVHARESQGRISVEGVFAVGGALRRERMAARAETVDAAEALGAELGLRLAS